MAGIAARTEELTGIAPDAIPFDALIARQHPVILKGVARVDGRSVIDGTMSFPSYKENGEGKLLEAGDPLPHQFLPGPADRRLYGRARDQWPLPLYA